MVLASLVAAVGVAACGSSSNAASSSKSAASTSSASARQKFTTCLKQHGVTLPSRPAGAGGYGPGAGGGYGPPAGGTVPGAGTTGSANGNGSGGGGFFGGGARNSKFAQAFRACSKYSPNLGNRPAGQFRQRFSTKALDTFVSCVRKHGYPQMPSPKATGGGGFFPKSIETNPKFKAAAAKCESVLRQALSQARAGAAGTTTSTTGASSQT